MDRIPVAGPSISQKEIDYVTDAVTRCWGPDAGEYHQRFESTACDYFGSHFAVALPSCTSALHLSLAALGVGPGDEVIVPDVTWIASAAPISYVGATPVFADIDPRTWCLSPTSLERCITEKTRAIIVVDLYGNMPDMDALLAIADRYQIPVIEDSAEAIGSEYNGLKAGRHGVTGVFSFHGSKTLTTYEGGMLITDDEAIFDRVSFLRDHGRVPGDVSFFNAEVGFKYKMSSMQAALGLAQLERADQLIEQKRQIFQWYADRLADVDGVVLNPEPVGVKNSYWMVTAVLDSQIGLRKHELSRQLSVAGIDSRPFFHPLSSLPAYRDSLTAMRAQKHNKHAYAVSPFGINLPSGYSTTEASVDYVCQQLKSILAGSQLERMAA